MTHGGSSIESPLSIQADPAASAFGLPVIQGSALFDGGRPKVSHLGFQGVSRPYRIGSIKIVSSPHVAHSKVRCPKPGLSGVMRVTLMSLPHIGQERRAIEDLVWMVC